MRYSYEFKRKCVEMYRSGQWPETLEGIQQKRFRDTVCQWVRLEDANGPEVLQHKSSNKAWTWKSNGQYRKKTGRWGSEICTKRKPGVNVLFAADHFPEMVRFLDILRENQNIKIGIWRYDVDHPEKCLETGIIQ